MASSTDIANLALLRLGESRINSLADETDKNARVCNVNWEQARQRSLMMCRWRFAKKQTGISKLAAAPVYKWQGAYQLPADYLRLTEIEGDDVWQPKEYFDIQGKKLLTFPVNDFDTPSASLNIEYIFDEQDTSQYDASFIEVLSTQLASMVARSLTGSDQIGPALKQELETVSLPKAMEINGHMLYTDNNAPIRKILADSMLRKSRRAGYTSNSGLDT